MPVICSGNRVWLPVAPCTALECRGSRLTVMVDMPVPSQSADEPGNHITPASRVRRSHSGDLDVEAEAPARRVRACVDRAEDIEPNPEHREHRVGFLAGLWGMLFRGARQPGGCSRGADRDDAERLHSPPSTSPHGEPRTPPVSQRVAARTPQATTSHVGRSPASTSPGACAQDAAGDAATKSASSFDGSVQKS